MICEATYEEMQGHRHFLSESTDQESPTPSRFFVPFQRFQHFHSSPPRPIASMSSSAQKSRTFQVLQKYDRLQSINCVFLGYLQNFSECQTQLMTVDPYSSPLRAQ